jgi:hypothetical protein
MIQTMFFFLLPVWVLSLVAGTVLLLFVRLRSLAVHILLVPTCGLIAVTVLPLAATLAGSFVGDTFVGWLVLGALIVGGPLGIAVGFMLSRQVNNSLGWSEAGNE